MGGVIVGNIVPFYPEQAAAILERLLAQGDLSGLTHQERAEYYLRVCHSVGLNPYTQPFGYIKFKDGALKLYAFKGCTDQLRKLHNVSVVESSGKEWRGLFIAKVKVATPDGRTHEDIGSVSIAGLAGDALANATMKAETKAKRRATLAVCGLGLLDETEVETIPGAVKVHDPAAFPQLPAGEEASAKAPRTIAAAPKRRLEAEFHPHPEMVREPRPNRRLAADRRIDARYEAVIRQDEPRKKPARYCEAEMVKADAAEWAEYRRAQEGGPPEPPPHDRIPDGRDR
jgi:hypothetical protein